MDDADVCGEVSERGVREREDVHSWRKKNPATYACSKKLTRIVKRFGVGLR